MNVSSLVMFYNINKELTIQYFNYYSVAVAVIYSKDGRTSKFESQKKNGAVVDLFDSLLISTQTKGSTMPQTTNEIEKGLGVLFDDCVRHTTNI